MLFATATVHTNTYGTGAQQRTAFPVPFEMYARARARTSPEHAGMERTREHRNGIKLMPTICCREFGRINCKLYRVSVRCVADKKVFTLCLRRSHRFVRAHVVLCCTAYRECVCVYVCVSHVQFGFNCWVECNAPMHTTKVDHTISLCARCRWFILCVCVCASWVNECLLIIQLANRTGVWALAN